MVYTHQVAARAVPFAPPPQRSASPLFALARERRLVRRSVAAAAAGHSRRCRRCRLRWRRCRRRRRRREHHRRWRSARRRRRCRRRPVAAAVVARRRHQPALALRRSSTVPATIDCLDSSAPTSEPTSRSSCVPLQRRRRRAARCPTTSCRNEALSDPSLPTMSARCCCSGPMASHRHQPPQQQ